MFSTIPPSPRVRIAVEASIDAHHSAQLDILEGTMLPPRTNVTNFVEDLWNATSNQDVVQSFMTNKLCLDAAKGGARAERAFTYYAVQDYFYLVDFVKARALRLASIPQDDLAALELEAASIGRSCRWAKEWYDLCVTVLKIDPHQLQRSVSELAYANVIQNTHGKSFYSLHVILLGCYYGWSKLALELFPTADKTTNFYKMWLLPNVSVDDDSGTARLSASAVKIAKFLNENHAKYKSEIQDAETSRLFRLGLQLEVAMFDEAYNASS